MANPAFDWFRPVIDPDEPHPVAWMRGMRNFAIPSFEDHEPSECFGPEHFSPGEFHGGAGFEQLAVMISSRLEQALQFRYLEGQVADLAERVDLLERRVAKDTGTVARIQTLTPEPYRLLQPIEVSIMASADGEFLASFYDANITASGDNEQEAFENVKDLILDMFDSLSAEKEERLGPEPARQLAVLREFIGFA